MASKRKRIRENSTGVDDNCLRKLNLLPVCGYCSKLVGNDEQDHTKHAKSHEKTITQCRTCSIHMEFADTEKHLKEIHISNRNKIRFYVDKSLIELRIAAGKTFSNFWGIYFTSTDTCLRNSFASTSTRWWNNYKNGRSIGVFRVLKSKLNWKCAICESQPTMVFNETISMRAYAISHLEQHHFDEIMFNIPCFFEFEWFHLNEELDFDVRSLTQLAQKKLKLPYRSFLTFYTTSLSQMENGEKFLRELTKRSGIENGEVRYCLVCCSVVPVDSLRAHFRLRMHSQLEAVAESTIFIQVGRGSEEKDGKQEGKQEDNEETFEFPRELFLYSKSFKTLRRDEYKWRCCLCPRAHAQAFATQIIMRMYALRHIENHHSFLFTEPFLAFEWASLLHEMRGSFDIRTFTPLQYTVKGENTFNKRDPNDYVLPQQYYFLPQQCVQDTVICGFCYRSFNRKDFLLHIVLHGFGTEHSDISELRPVVLNAEISELMGRSNYLKRALDDEPYKILSVDGKRLKAKMELMSKRNYSDIPGFSEITTPCKSERDTDAEFTPHRRKSAMDARKLLTETFKVLQVNARNRKDTWNESSCSSSSDDENSEDERFEKDLDIEATTKIERLERSKIQEMKKRDISKMTPVEIREWIKEEAKKRGVEWKDESDSSPSSSDDSTDFEEKPSTPGKNNWSKMKLADIKKAIREAAKRKRVEMGTGSSSSSEDDD